MTCAKGTMMHSWTPDEQTYLAEIVQGRSHIEIRDLMTERFGDHFGGKRITAAIKRYGLKTGRAGQFRKGIAPTNKGKTWIDQGISEEVQARMRLGQFRPGQDAHNHRPLGSERVMKDEYIWVKVREAYDPDKYNDWRDLWIPKHRAVWEEHNGKMPDGSIIVFADGDIRNFDPDNLVRMTKAQHMVICHLHIEYYDRESCIAAMKLADYHAAVHARACYERVCKSCGQTFKPDQPRQRRCRDCIDDKRGTK
jgi:hypothetical protein